MKAKERIIYDNYNTEDLEAECREYLIWDGNEDPSEDQIYNELMFRLDYYWDEFKREANKLLAGTCLAVGTAGRWDGTCSGGFIFEGITGLMKHFDHCDYFKIWDENGHLFLRGYHHDGTDTVEIKHVTDKGRTYFENWSWNLQDHRTLQEVHSRMMHDSHYTNLINYIYNIYDLPKREFCKN